MIDRPEQVIHRAAIQHLRQRAVPGVVFWHTPNGAALGGKRNRKGISIQGSIMKGLDVRPGVSDIVALHAGRFFALELKAPGGRPTEAQCEFLADVARAGGFTAVAEGIDAALRALEGWGLLRGQAS